MVDQERNGFVHGRLSHQLQVIQDEAQPFRQRTQLIDQWPHQDIDRGRWNQGTHIGQDFAELGTLALNRADEMHQEAQWVVVAGIQRQPCDRRGTGGGPTRGQCRLTVAGGCADQHHARRLFRLLQARPRQQVRSGGGDHEFGRQNLVGQQDLAGMVGQIAHLITDPF